MLKTTIEEIQGEICVNKKCNRKISQHGYCAFCLKDMGAKQRIIVSSHSGQNGCWEWKGALRGARSSYGILSVNNRSVVAHRYSYEAFVGEIPAGLFVLHKCDNKKCVNPDHLEIGSASKNTKDAYNRNLMPKGEKYWSAKLTDTQRQQMHNLLDAGATQIDMAVKYGISQSSVSESYKKHKDDALTHAADKDGNRVDVAIEGGE